MSLKELSQALKQAKTLKEKSDLIFKSIAHDLPACHVCENAGVELIECEICGELYCPECGAEYNQFSQIDYNCCTSCAESRRQG